MSSAAATLDVFLNRLSEVSTPFSIELPSGEKRKVGLGEEEFRVGLRNERALKALRRPSIPSAALLATPPKQEPGFGVEEAVEERKDEERQQRGGHDAADDDGG